MGGEGKQPKSAAAEELLKRLENGLVPDEEFRRLVRVEVARRLKWGYKPTYEEQLAQVLDLVKSLKKMNMAKEIEALDAKLYEIPMAFVKLVFGKALKESSCYFKDESVTLDEAEIAMLDLCCERAQIQDGQTILDLGCGQGPFTFHVARKYKNCHVTAVTNSISQKDYIEEQCKNLQLSNVEVILEDVTKLETEATFDRIIVVGLLEHMKNFELFLRRVAKWMNHDSLLFVEHVCHKTLAYEYEVIDDDDWHTDLFFPSATFIMPSASLLLYFQEDVSVVDHWIFNGKNFGLTNKAWLKNLDSNMDEIKKILESSTGSEEEAMKMIIYWRNSFMAGSELFLYNDGEEWMGSHVVFKKK
ncbi:pavine N-methyltransferase-like [Magnolia sinica]|uniref:pavine N-methyltransferase-like n=1 Tax=Magnolia sinica TaxID=86752 RepID=UPI00265A4F9A|nr:pavine N-methyltransferase-like [Magnolia sinica]